SAQGADTLEGRAFETSATLPYLAVTEALRERLARDANPRRWLSDLWLAELSRLLPELAERFDDLPAPLAVGEADARTRLFEAFARLCQALAASAPLVLFVDDLQWSDTASRDLMQYAARRWQRARL